VAVALLLAQGADLAVPQKRIVIHGTSAGTHLRLEVRRGRLLVDGRMTKGISRDCHPAARGGIAVCGLGQVGSIEVDTGPSGDMVEVLKKLPVPLTVYLGPGADKFIGNGERDTCYPGGTRRNRCVAVATSASPVPVTPTASAAPATTTARRAAAAMAAGAVPAAMSA
jgi:hypothetical protein